LWSGGEHTRVFKRNEFVTQLPTRCCITFKDYVTVLSIMTICNDAVRVNLFCFAGRIMRGKMCQCWRGCVSSAMNNSLFWDKGTRKLHVLILTYGYIFYSSNTTTTFSVFYSSLLSHLHPCNLYMCMYSIQLETICNHLVLELNAQSDVQTRTEIRST